MTARSHPYHTITLIAPITFLTDVDSVLQAWLQQCEVPLLHTSIEYPPESDPIYRLSIPGQGDDLYFLISLVHDLAERAGFEEPKVSSSTTWHTFELQPGQHSADAMTAELLRIGYYEFTYTVPEWYPLDLFDFITLRVFTELGIAPNEDAGFSGFASEWVWMPDETYAIQLTIYGRPTFAEDVFERALGAALSTSILPTYVTDWLAYAYETSDTEGEP